MVLLSTTMLTNNIISDGIIIQNLQSDSSIGDAFELSCNEQGQPCPPPTPHPSPPLSPHLNKEKIKPMEELVNKIEDMCITELGQIYIPNKVTCVSHKQSLPLFAGEDIPLDQLKAHKWVTMHIKILPGITRKSGIIDTTGYMTCLVEKSFSDQILVPDVDSCIVKTEWVTYEQNGVVLGMYRPVALTAKMTEATIERYKRDPYLRHVYAYTEGLKKDITGLREIDPMMQEILDSMGASRAELELARMESIKRAANRDKEMEQLSKYIDVSINDFPELVAEGSVPPEHNELISILKKDIASILDQRQMNSKK